MFIHKKNIEKKKLNNQQCGSVGMFVVNGWVWKNLFLSHIHIFFYPPGADIQKTEKKISEEKTEMKQCDFKKRKTVSNENNQEKNIYWQTISIRLGPGLNSMGQDFTFVKNL